MTMSVIPPRRLRPTSAPPRPPAAAATVVILDDDVAMLAAVARLLRREGFIVVATTDPRQAMEEVIRCGADAIVTDIYLHGVDGNLVLAMLATAAPKTARLVLTSETDFEAAAGMSIPFSVDAFVSKREVTGRLVSTLRLVTGFVQGDGALDRSAEARDQAAAMDMALHIMRAVSSKEDRDHASRVAAWSHRLGRAVGLGSADLLTLELGALLHDIGEVGLAQGMLDARRRLTPTELTRLHRHPDLGGAMLAGLPMLRRAIPLVRTHHERWDGGGYPRGIGGNAIPFESRIFQIVDAYDAMRRSRPHRVAYPDGMARAELARHAGLQFDPEVHDAFARIDPDDWTSVVAHVSGDDAVD